MSASGAGYDQSVSTFSPNGRVFQVEYAAKAVEKSGTVIGIRCVDGVVFGVEKSVITPLLNPNSNRRILSIDYHVGLAAAGLSSDARALANKARNEAADYLSFYGSPIPGKVLSDRLAGHMHTHTLYWYVRPYGVAALLSVYDEYDGGQLYGLEPSGVCYSYFACAYGKHKSAAQSELEKLPLSTLTSKQAVEEIARIIVKLHDSAKDKSLEIEMSWVGKETNGKHKLVPTQLRDEAMKRAEEIKIKEEMEESDDEEQEENKNDSNTNNSATSSPTTSSTRGT